MVLNCANALGREIALRNQILLTGGIAAGSRTVKGCAIAGADGFPWIGVDSYGQPGTRWSYADPPSVGFLIRSGLGAKRNYLEASLCDAAIALEGAEGTTSEVTCALSIGRPVVLVGHTWEKYSDLLANDVLGDLIKTSVKAFNKESLETPFDAEITEEALRSQLEARRQSFRCHYVETLAAPDRIVDLAIDSVSDPDRHEFHFPDKGGNDVADALKVWLTACGAVRSD